MGIVPEDLSFIDLAHAAPVIAFCGHLAVQEQAVQDLGIFIIVADQRTRIGAGDRRVIKDTLIRIVKLVHVMDLSGLDIIHPVI